MKYSSEQIAHIQAHYNKDKTSPQIAAHIGVSESVLRNSIMELRKAGHQFAAKAAAIGETRIIKSKGRMVRKTKTADGWKYEGVVSPKVQKGVLPIGTIRVRMGCTYVKKESGWELIPRGPVKPPQPKKTPAPPKEAKAPKIVVPVIRGGDGYVNNDRNPEQVKIRKPEGPVKWQRIDHKTWKQVPVYASI